MPSVGRKKGTVSGILTIVPPSASVATYLAFFDDGAGTVAAANYASDGSYLADVGVPQSGAGTSPSANKVLLIRTDAGGFVADNTLAWWEAGDITTVQPLVGATSFTAQTLGWVADGIGFLAGWFYWMEREATPHTGSTTTFRLRKCRTDGSGAATVQTVDYTPGNDHDGNVLPSFIHWNTSGAAGILDFRITPTSCAVQSQWTASGPVTIFVTCRIPLTGSGTTDDFDTNRGGYARPPQGCVPDASQTIYFDAGLQSAADGLLAPPVAIWPTSGAWDLSVAVFNVDVLGSDALAYGSDGIDLFVVRNVYPSVAASPTVRVAMAAHPTLMVQPSWVFMLT